MKEQKKKLVHEAILDISEKLFIEGGPEAVNIRKIANEIGYSATNIYKYFESKEDILHQLISRRMNEIVDTLNQVNTAGLSTVDALKKTFKVHFHSVLKYGEHYKSVMLSNDPFIIKRTAMLDPKDYVKLPPQMKLVNQIKTGIANKEIKDIDPIITAQIIWAGLFGILTRIIIEKYQDKAYINQMIDHFLDSIFKGIQV